MRNFVLRFTASLLCFAAAEAAQPVWEAPLPNGQHTDPIALNKAAGDTGAATLDMVKGAKGELQPQNFPDLKSKTPLDGIFRVILKNEGAILRRPSQLFARASHLPSVKRWINT